LNLLLAIAMLTGLIIATPPLALIAIPMLIVTAASAVAELFER
jgi:hypothetical protein